MMNNGQNRVQMCLCDGRYLGCEHGSYCGEPAGGHRSPYFCGDCDPRRIESLSASLAGIQRQLAGGAR